MPDRRTNPAGLKKLEFGAQKPAAKIEAAKPVRILECPPELSQMARQEWQRIVAELTPMAVLSSVDRAPLAAYCVAYALWIEATEMLQKHNTMIKSPNGYPQQSPYFAVANKQLEIMLRISCEFGFTPASRSRIFSFTQKNAMLLDGVAEPDDGDLW